MTCPTKLKKRRWKKSFLVLLLCSSFIFNSVKAAAVAAAPVLLKTVAGTSLRVLAATATLGPSIMTVTLVGTVAAIGEADEKRKKAGSTHPLTLTDIAHGWLYQYERIKNGYNVCESAFLEAYNAEVNKPKDHDEPRPQPVTQQPVSFAQETLVSAELENRKDPITVKTLIDPKE